jgi:hypothetical protein
MAGQTPLVTTLIRQLSHEVPLMFQTINTLQIG